MNIIHVRTLNTHVEKLHNQLLAGILFIILLVCGIHDEVLFSVKTDCPDNRLQMFHGSCYLFVSYPQVTWQTAQDICNGVQVWLSFNLPKYLIN